MEQRIPTVMGHLRTSYTITCPPFLTAHSWGAEENHPYTDKLLTIIEDSFRYLQAFGFAIGNTPPVTSGGQTLISLAQEIASKLWPGRVIIGKKVPLSVKNWITKYVTSASWGRFVD